MLMEKQVMNFLITNQKMAEKSMIMPKSSVLTWGMIQMNLDVL